MDFILDKKHEMARSLFRDFAQNEVKPLAQEVDETEQFPVGTVEKMQKLGFMGIPVPQELGGQGCDILTYAMCVEELSSSLRYYRCYCISSYITLRRPNFNIRNTGTEGKICKTTCNR